jgi:hypothetical protein
MRPAMADFDESDDKAIYMMPKGQSCWKDTVHDGEREPTKDQQALRQLKRQVITDSNVRYRFTDAAYRRFLNGKKGNIKEACVAMVNNAKWREMVKPDQLSATDCLNVVAKHMAIVHKHDKAGRAVIYIFLSRHNTYERDLDEMKRFIIYMLETSIFLSAPKANEQITLVFDMKDFSLNKNMDFEVAKVLVDTLQNNYPEVRHIMY